MKIDNIVVGKSLASLLYCWKTQTRCIMHEPIQPHRFDKEYCGYDFSFVNANDDAGRWFCPATRRRRTGRRRWSHSSRRNARRMNFFHAHAYHHLTIARHKSRIHHRYYRAIFPPSSTVVTTTGCCAGATAVGNSK